MKSRPQQDPKKKAQKKWSLARAARTRGAEGQGAFMTRSREAELARLNL
jgi:hypothetical protein